MGFPARPPPPPPRPAPSIKEHRAQVIGSQLVVPGDCECLLPRFRVKKVFEASSAQ